MSAPPVIPAEAPPIVMAGHDPPPIVMAGRGPAIHVFLVGQISRPCIDMSSTTSLYAREEVVDGRATPGHDGRDGR